MGVTILPGRATTAHLGLVRIANGLQVDTAGNLSVNLAASDIPNLNASKITAGTLDLARLSGITTSQLDAAAGITSAQIAALDAAKITSGTLPLARLSGITTSQLDAAAGIVSGQIASVAASTLTGTVALARLSGITTSQLDAAAGITSAQIAALDAAKITSGTLPLARLSAITTTQLASAAGILGSQLDAAAAIASGQITSLAASKITGTNTLPDGVLSTNVPLLNAANTFTALQTATAFAPSGLTGSTAATRYVGGTTSGAPASGAHNKGDWAITQDGSIYICTTAGTPGTWTAVSGGGGGFTSPLTTKGDVHAYSTTDARVAVGADGTFLSADSSQATGLAYKFPAGVAGVSTLTSALSADVTIVNANTFYDGPSITLTAGTWLIGGVVTVEAPAPANAVASAKLWDGTTAYSSGELMAGTSAYSTIPLPPTIVTPTTTTTYKISVAYQTGGSNGKIKAALVVNGAGNNASTITAVQLTGAPASGPGALMPAVRASNSSTVSVTAGTFTTITLNTTDLDQGTSTAQHSTSSNTSRLTCQQAGVYQITAHVHPSGTTTETALQLVLNGSTIIGYQDQGATGGATVTTLYHLNVGDYVELQLYETVSSGSAGAGYFAAYSPTLMMARIDSGPGAVQPNTRVQLDYQANTDIAAGVSISASTWTDIGSNQTFTVDDVNSVVEIAVSGMALGFNGAANTDWGVRINVDSGGTPITRMIGGGRQAAGSIYMNILSGMGTIDLTGLTAGSHTVKVQLYASQSGTFYCQPAASPNLYNFSIRVLERKQSSSPPSSTPAPAVRCYNSANISCSNNTDTLLTFDTNRVDQGVSTAQHSTSSNTGRLTCQQAGMYQITAAARFAANSTGMRRLDLLLNGTTNIGSSTVPQAGSDVLFVNVSTLYQLVVGDYVIVNAVQDSGGSLNVVADGNRSPEFMMCRVDSGGQGFVPIPILKTANYTILNSDCLVVAGAGSLTFTLPAASSRAPGMPIVVKNDNFTSTTIARAGSDTIDGATSYSLPGAYSSITLVGDGVSVWRAI